MARSDVLVSTAWVAEHLDDPNVVLIEADEDVNMYAEGHIQGAVSLDWRRDLQDPVRRDVISPVQFAELMSTLGVNPESTVVLYAANNNWFAAYSLWYFTMYGHRDVKLLDGGRKKWELDGRELVKDAPTRERTEYPVPAEDSSHRARRDEIIAGLGSLQLIDVRSPDEYSGAMLAPSHLPQEQSYRPGHIPTAINVPWNLAANNDGTFRENDELARIYAEAGITPDRVTVAYCRIGERSAYTWFVLHELLGWADVRNYDGSWTEYGSLVGVPVAIGDEPGSAEGSR